MLIKILVVDDSASNRMLIKNMLSDYSVLTASDGKDAIRQINEHSDINLLILDLNIPNMDGFEILETLKSDNRYKNLPAIILTNNDELDKEAKGIELGAVDYIRKPIHLNSLRARIDVHAELIRIQHLFEQTLYEQSITFDAIFHQVPFGIAISHSLNPFKVSRNNITSINRMFEQITGRTKEELVKLGWAKITHPDDVEEDIKNFKKLQSGEVKSYSMDKRYIKPDGTIVWVHMLVAPLTLANDYQYNHICLVQDITERKIIEKALAESERSKSILLSHLPGLAYRCNYDCEWTMQFVSDGCFNLTGYNVRSLLNNKELSFNDLILPKYREALRKEWERILDRKQPFKYEYEIKTATGEQKWVLEMGQGIYKDNGEVEALEGIILDISNRKEIENNLRYVNEHDGWTGLYNLDYLEKLLENDAKEKNTFKKALVSINLTTVQLLTANYGFHYTQNLIKKAAEVLTGYCNDNCMLFKTYENHFVFYLKNYKDKNELIVFSEAVADTLESIFVTDRIGGGIGILEIEQVDNNIDVDVLLRSLLIASERSINIFDRDFKACFYDERLEALVNRERDIRQALSAIVANDTSDDLFLQYQPILDLKTGSICGFEALTRLRTEKLGLVSPVEFIPIAEKTKLIIPIGDKVILSAFRFLNILKEHGFKTISVSINISAIQLLGPDFTNRLLKMINEMQINPSNIGIEITESIFTSDYAHINNIISKLKDVGLNMAIDDFGTGYSSFAREKELNINCLKIDKYFIDKLLDIDIDKAITKDIVSMAHRLGHCAVAEGVEHEKQLQYLKAYGCDKVQGYLISKPLDEEAALEFLINQVNNNE